MRIGANYNMPFTTYGEADRMVEDLQVSAVVSMVTVSDCEETIKNFKEWARSRNIQIAEVGVWNNPIARDPIERKKNLEFAKQSLQLAEELEAACCVNIAGSRGELWDGYDKDNYRKDTYAMVVDSVRDIIDSVKPKHTCYTLEPMPWMYPDGPWTYLQLGKDIDREAFGVHLDFTNMINSMKRYHNRNAFISQCFQVLGPYIKSVHLKDILLMDQLPCAMKEVLPGDGVIDLKAVLQHVQALGREVPVLVEHLADYGEYKEAVRRVRGLEKEIGGLRDAKEREKENG